MIRFDCVCGRQLQADARQAGSRAACPACARIVTVPDEAAGVVCAVPGSEAVPLPAAIPPGEPRPAAAGPPVPAAHGPIRQKASKKALASLLLAIFLLAVTFATASSHSRPRRNALALGGVVLIVLSGLALWDAGRKRTRLGGGWVPLTGFVAGAVCLWQIDPFADLVTSEVTVYDQLRYQMEELTLALHNFADANGRLPPAATRSPGGKLLLSWRVAILPYLEEGRSLYQEFHLDEPWDSPHNIRLLKRMPRVFADPVEATPAGTTRFQVYFGPGSPFESPDGHAIAEFRNHLSATILLVEGAEPVPWTKPMDLPCGPQVALVRPYVRWKEKRRCLIAAADGSTYSIPVDTPEETLRALISRNGEKVEWPD